MSFAMRAHLENNDRRIFWAFAALLCLSFILYVSFVFLSVHSVIARKSAESESNRITARISSLESQYVSLDKHIDLALAHHSGYADVVDPIYISKESARAVFTMRSDEAGR